jgi:hypothetical protein
VPYSFSESINKQILPYSFSESINKQVLQLIYVGDPTTSSAAIPKARIQNGFEG